MMQDHFKQQANAHFRTVERKIVISESEAGAASVAANSARLKGLRLARDAAEQTVRRETVPAKKIVSKKKLPMTSPSE